jgi:hypothetical protein
MAVLIVIESHFGNSLTIAQAVAAGLVKALGQDAVNVVRPQEAPRELSSDVDLLLVGAPTHNYSLSTAATREQAAGKGATEGDRVGVREWIDQLTPRADLRVITFDTSIKTWFMPSTAAKSAAKALKKRGFSRAERGPSFYVTGVAGPLTDGEVSRAEAWGTSLAASVTRS